MVSLPASTVDDRASNAMRSRALLRDSSNDRSRLNMIACQSGFVWTRVAARSIDLHDGERNRLRRIMSVWRPCFCLCYVAMKPWLISRLADLVIANAARGNGRKYARLLASIVPLWVLDLDRVMGFVSVGGDLRSTR